MRRSVLGFHWFRRRARGRHRLKGPRPPPLQSIEACESRLMPGTLLGSAIDPLAGALSLLWTSDRDPGIEKRDPLPKSSGQTPDAKSKSDFTSALSSDTKGSGVSRPDPSAATGNEGTPSASSIPDSVTPFRPESSIRRSVRNKIPRRPAGHRLTRDPRLRAPPRTGKTTEEAVTEAARRRRLAAAGAGAST